MKTKVKKELEAFVQREIDNHEVMELFVREIFGTRKEALRYLSQLRGEKDDSFKEPVQRYEFEFEVISKVIE